MPRFFFFFQAEDGIRDADVTGVQTCALPIWNVRHPGRLRADAVRAGVGGPFGPERAARAEDRLPDCRRRGHGVPDGRLPAPHPLERGAEPERGDARRAAGRRRHGAEHGADADRRSELGAPDRPRHRHLHDAVFSRGGRRARAQRDGGGDDPASGGRARDGGGVARRLRRGPGRVHRSARVGIAGAGGQCARPRARRHARRAHPRGRMTMAGDVPLLERLAQLPAIPAAAATTLIERLPQPPKDPVLGPLFGTDQEGDAVVNALVPTVLNQFQDKPDLTCYQALLEGLTGIWNASVRAAVVARLRAAGLPPADLLLRLQKLSPTLGFAHEKGGDWAREWLADRIPPAVLPFLP